MCLCLTMIQLNAEEVYQCNNETQTCITESLRGEQNEQQLYNIPSPLSSWKELPQCRGKILLEDSSGFISDGTGNYSLDTKCSWLLTTDAPNSTIILQLIEFATECSWDHLYIYDGDSVLAPLLAVYSGLTLYGDYRVQEVNEVTTSSNSVLLHFYSDLAYNMSGFNISYSINSCPVNKDGKKCSGNGVCIDSSCTCDAAFYGQSCQYAICPDNCSEHGFCNMETHSCICDEGWSGLDCNQPKGRGFWMSVWKPNETQQNHLARTQSSGAIWKGILWVVGGHTLDLDFPLTMAFNISDNAWLPVETNGLFIPRPRHGHSTVIYNGILYMYGGVTQDGDILSQLWTLNLSTKEWTQLMPSRNKECYHRPCGPVAAAGHSVVLVKDKMYTIFGYNPIYGYLNLIQEYSIDNRIWSVVSTSGALVQGSYGHSSVWDPLTKRIYVYGGYRSESSSIYELTNALYSYDPAQKVWRTHPSSGSYRYLHSAVMSGGLMLVYGGNTHNETAISNGAKCYSSDFIAYDTICDTWYKLQQPLPKSVGGDLSRYGHLAVSFGLSYEVEVDDEYHQPLLPYGMLVFGGFDGQLKSDVLVYVIGDCTSLSTKELCLTAMPGVKCVWNKAAKKCEPLASLFKEGYEKCPVSATESPDAVSGWPVSAWPIGNQMNYTSLCSSISSCPTCLHTTFNCVWCGHSCQYAKCKEGFSKGFPSLHTSLVQCQVADANSCRLLHSCSACHTEPHCRWESDARCYTYVRKVGNRTEKVDVKDEQTCDIPCSMRTNCRNCTHGSCLWCSNQNRCVDKNAYIPSFPYGLCTEWTTQSTKCRDPDFPELEESEITNRNTPLGASVYTKMTTCVSYRTCASCQEDPSCGWCDDGTNRGTGSCMPGGYGGSMTTLFKQATDFQCPADRWYFTDCPLCQCNGHSTCEEATQLCNQPCLHLTEGNHCESCTPGYFGNPVNGGVCAPCQCSGHGTQCHPLTGRCFCTTKGVVGDHCERCDVANHYSSGLLTVTPATSSNLTFLPTCYYDLQLDFQFTFNLSKKEDRHIKQINFRNVPLKPDLDLEFSVLCSSVAKLNISVRSVKPNSLHKTMDDFDEEKFLLVNHTFTTFKSRFLRSDYHFGTDENTTFYVYVYDFQSPIWIQVSFSQHPKLELQQFFITFSACFISLLMMAAILWKIKQKYDMYRRRQRLFVEMEQMASRPFSHVLVELQVPPTFRRRTHVPYANRCQSVMTDSRSQTAANSTTVETSFSCTASPYGHPHPTVPAQTVRRRRRFRPSPIALEPCADQKAAVLSLLIRLPSGTLPYTPPGQSGLAIASTLVSLGSYASRKNVTDSRDMTRSIPKAKTPPTLTQLP